MTAANTCAPRVDARCCLLLGRYPHPIHGTARNIYNITALGYFSDPMFPKNNKRAGGGTSQNGGEWKGGNAQRKPVASKKYRRHLSRHHAVHRIARTITTPPPEDDISDPIFSKNRKRGRGGGGGGHDAYRKRVASKKSGFFTGHGPIRGSGQEVVLGDISKSHGSEAVGSTVFHSSSRVGPGHPDPRVVSRPGKGPGKDLVQPSVRRRVAWRLL